MSNRLSHFIRNHAFKKTEIKRNPIWVSLKEQADNFAWSGTSFAKILDSIFNVAFRSMVLFATALLYPLGIIALMEQVFRSIINELWDELEGKYDFNFLSSAVALFVAGVFWLASAVLCLPTIIFIPISKLKKWLEVRQSLSGRGGFLAMGIGLALCIALGVLAARGFNSNNQIVETQTTSVETQTTEEAISVQDIVLDSSSVYLEMGETYQINANISPSDANATILYGSDDIDVSADGLISAPPYDDDDSYTDKTYNVTVSAGEITKSITVYVRNSYKWSWDKEKDWNTDDLSTGAMLLDKIIPSCTGFTLGIKLDEGDLGDWQIYVRSGDDEYVGEEVGNVTISELGEWSYADISFTERDIHEILIFSPKDSENSWRMYADLKALVYNGHTH